ncbi:hypothetical protein G9A89_022918 [Geosiphon pyriformis]|nr:hypothetical protein G9A89_022918 [Geosiphon pyriformis]
MALLSKPSSNLAVAATATKQIGRGALIIFEGCDRAGKSTQAAKLVEYIKQKYSRIGLGDNKLENNNAIEPVRLWKFPGTVPTTHRTTPIGLIINDYLKCKDLDDRSIHLLFSANRWECMTSIKNILLSGTTVIMDRYAYSGVAYSAAKGIDIDWCKSPDVGLIQPDLVFFMDLSSEEAMKRSGFGEERYEKQAFQEKVRTMFMKLQDPSWKVLDARQSKSELHEQIIQASLDTIEKCASMPLREDLWKNGFEINTNCPPICTCLNSQQVKFIVLSFITTALIYYNCFTKV